MGRWKRDRECICGIEFGYGDIVLTACDHWSIHIVEEYESNADSYFADYITVLKETSSVRKQREWLDVVTLFSYRAFKIIGIER